jgi:hypothetical protein
VPIALPLVLLLFAPPPAEGPATSGVRPLDGEVTADIWRVMQHVLALETPSRFAARRDVVLRVEPGRGRGDAAAPDEPVLVAEISWRFDDPARAERSRKRTRARRGDRADGLPPEIDVQPPPTEWRLVELRDGVRLRSATKRATAGGPARPLSAGVAEGWLIVDPSPDEPLAQLTVVVELGDPGVLEAGSLGLLPATRGEVRLGRGLELDVLAPTAVTPFSYGNDDAPLVRAGKGEWEASEVAAATDDRVAPRRGGRFLHAGDVLQWAQRTPHERDDGALVFAKVGLGLTVADGEVRSRARVRFEVRRGELERARIDLSALGFTGGGADLRVTPPPGVEATHEGSTLVLTPEAPIRDAIEVGLEWSSAVADTDLVHTDVAAPRPLDVWRSETALQIARDAEIEVFPTCDGCTPVSVGELPTHGRDLVEGTPLAAYVDVQRAGVDLVRFTPLEEPPVIVDVAAYDLALSREGRVVISIRYDVRNDRAPYLALKLRDGQRLLGVRIDGDTALLGQQGDDIVLIPLPRSIETVDGLLSFPVEISVLGADLPRFARKDGRSIALPAVDAPVAVARTTVRLPPGWLERKGKARPRNRVDDFDRGEGISYGFKKGDARTEVADELYRGAVRAWLDNDFAGAQRSLDEVRSLGGDNENVAKLQSNLDVVSGKLDERQVDARKQAAVRRVKAQARERGRSASFEQEKTLAVAKEAELRGDYEEAARGYSQALDIGNELAKLEDSYSVERGKDNAVIAENLLRNSTRLPAQAPMDLPSGDVTGNSIDELAEYEFEADLEGERIATKGDATVTLPQGKKKARWEPPAPQRASGGQDPLAPAEAPADWVIPARELPKSEASRVTSIDVGADLDIGGVYIEPSPALPPPPAPPPGEGQRLEGDLGGAPEEIWGGITGEVVGGVPGGVPGGVAGGIAGGAVANTTPTTTTTYEFEDDVLEGDLLRPDGATTASRDYTAVIDLAPTATRDSAGSSLGGTTGGEASYHVEGKNLSRTKGRPLHRTRATAGSKRSRGARGPAGAASPTPRTAAPATSDATSLSLAGASDAPVPAPDFARSRDDADEAEDLKAIEDVEGVADLEPPDAVEAEAYAEEAEATARPVSRTTVTEQREMEASSRPLRARGMATGRVLTKRKAEKKADRRPTNARAHDPFFDDSGPPITASNLSITIPAIGQELRYQQLLVPADQAPEILLDSRRDLRKTGRAP